MNHAHEFFVERFYSFRESVTWMDFLSHPVFLLDFSGTIAYFNSAAAQQFSLSSEDVGDSFLLRKFSFFSDDFFSFFEKVLSFESDFSFLEKFLFSSEVSQSLGGGNSFCVASSFEILDERYLMILFQKSCDACSLRAQLADEVYKKDLLARSTQKLEILSHDENIFQFIAEELFSLTKGVFVSVSQFFSESQTMKVAGFASRPSILQKVTKVLSFLGKSPLGFEVAVSEDALAEMQQGKFNFLPGGIHQLLMQEVPLFVANQAQKILHISEIWGSGLFWERLHGNVVVAFSPEQKPDITLLETFVDWCSIHLQKRQLFFDYQESEKKFRTIMQHLPQTIFETDTFGNFVFFNEASLRMFRYSSQEIFVKNIRDVIAPQDHFLLAENIQRRVSGENLGFQKYLAVRQNGSFFSVAVTATPVWKENRISGLCGIVLDLDEEQSLKIAFEKQEKQFQRILELAPDAIMIADRKTGKFLEANRAALLQLEYSRSELLQKTIFDIARSPQYTVWEDDKLTQKKAGTGFYETIQVSASGREIPTALSVYEDEEYFIGIARDITEQKKAELFLQEKEYRYRIISEISHMLVYDYFLESGRIFWQGKIAFLTGFEESEFQQFDIRDWENHIHPQDRDRVILLLESALLSSDGIFKAEYRFQKKDGDYFFVEDTGYFLRDSDSLLPYRMFGAMRDISSQKKVEEAIRSLNADLEQKIVERTQELQFSLRKQRDTNFALEQERQKLLETNSKLLLSEQELKTMIAMKDKFFSLVAHDLQDPIAGIIQLSEIFTLYYDDLDDQKKKNLYVSLEKTAKQTFAFLENLLLWARSQTGHFICSPHYFDFVGLFELVKIQVLQIFEKKNVRLSYSYQGETVAFFDPQVVLVILKNLLLNACKYSSSGSEVFVFSESIDGFLLISVQDFGVGIPENYQSHIFSLDGKFSTHGTAGEQGSGLGLILCKEFVQKSSGEIWFESVFQQGSTFFFTLPLSEN